MQRHRTQLAYTLMELLVALSIMLIIGFLINRIFFDTANAVSRGMATSRIIAASRTLSEQLYEDSLRQLSPTDGPPGGVLIIANKSYTGLWEMDPTKGGPAKRTYATRSDQLLFMVSLPSTTPQLISPLTPTDDDTFTGSSSAPYARVWYGHVQRSNADGTAPSVDLASSSGDSANNPQSQDYYATHWILGRQMLFFQEVNDAHINTLTSVYARGPYYNSTIAGYGSSPFGASPPLYSGLSDFAYYSYGDGSSNAAAANGGAYLVGSTAAALLSNGLAVNTYRSRAYDLLYFKERLLTNPAPQGTNFDSWRIAQTHPYFVEGASDFIVEFAADTEDDAAIAGFPDNAPDVDSATGNIVWYSASTPPTWNNHYTNAVGIGGLGYANPNDTPAVATYPFAGTVYTFRHDQPDIWPYLIRIRYRLHDPKGELQDYNYSSNQAEPGKWFEQILYVKRP